MRRTVIRTCAIALAAGIAAHAQAQSTTAVPGNARALAVTCTACHGADGRSVGGVPPSLAGRDRNELLTALKDFKAGKRPATIMHQHAKGYTDEQLDLIATYFSNVKAGPAAAAPAGRGTY